MRFLALVLCLFLFTGCNTLRPSWVSEESYEVEWDRDSYKDKEDDEIKPEDFNGPLGGHFDDEGNWIPDNEAIPLTYKIPDISAGFLFDVHSMDVTPCLQVELLEIHTPIPYAGTFKFDVGVGYQRAYGYVGILWTSIFEISTGGFVGWNWEDGELSYGVAATIIKF